MEKKRKEEDACCPKASGESKTKEQPRKMLMAQLIRIPFSRQLRKQDGNAGTGPYNQKQEQIHNASGNPRRCKAVLPQVPFDHQGIDHIVHLLQNIPCDQRA